MSRTESTMSLLPGSAAPAFELADTVSGQRRTLASLLGARATVLIFMCNHCPYVLHLVDGLLNVVRRYETQGVSFAGISSNDIDRYPQDAPPQMRELALQRGFGFAYLYDPTQAVARAYDAACTPDFYVLDADARLAYRGRFDDATPGNGRPVTGADLVAALDAVLAGSAPAGPQLPSMGCNIKWR